MHRLWQTLTARESWPIYAYLGLVGTIGVATGHGITPHSIGHVLPYWLVTAWTVSVAVGGLGSTVGYLVEKTRVESAGLALLAFGAGLYGMCVTVAAWPTGATVLAVSLAVLTMCLIRLRILARARTAQEVATQIVRGER